MYDFAILILLGLVTLMVVSFLEELVPAFGNIRTLATFGLGVAIAVALDYSLFHAFRISVRETWMGTGATGLMIGSVAHAWRVVLGYLGYSEDGEVTERHRGRPRIAA